VPQFRLNHVIRAPSVYLVPRSDGRILIGSTLEEVGFEKRVDPNVIRRLHEAAGAIVPAVNSATILESWAGLRPGTPDGLPIMGRTNREGYFVATGHFRDGVLLAPITAVLMAQLILGGGQPQFDLSAFSPSRFAIQGLDIPSA
jgi:glycine oxidase